jgi:class 3 adenylate cyclase/predicted ATPase
MEPKPATSEQARDAGALSGERRQVTALFYDIVGSTELLGRLDPEDFGRMQRALHEEASAAIRTHRGHLDRIQGDGGCAYFGLPESSEDAAESAVESALEIVRQCERLAEQGKSILQIRIGVATGLVVVAEVENNALPTRSEIIGLTPALAARIQSEAQPNSVVVAESTYRLTRGVFEFEFVGTRNLKGFGDSVEVWRPLRARRQGDRFTTHRRPDSPLIGRSRELALCREIAERAFAGEGQVIFVHGEAGIGKSRLVAELRATLRNRYSDITTYQCHPRGNTRPLHPFLDRLQQDVDARAAPSSGILKELIQDHLRARGRRLEEPDLQSLAFLVAGESGVQADTLWSVGLSAEEIRTRALGAILNMLLSAPDSFPRIIIVEDFHWADTLTQTVLSGLPQRIASRPCLIVVTSRDAPTADVASHGNVASIALSRLGATEIGELIVSIWDGPPPSRLATFAFDKSDGVPLFAEELTYLIKDRFFAREAFPADWEAAMREGGVLTLQDLVGARLAGLGPLRRIAQVASVIGREFALDLLERIINPDQIPSPLAEALETLIEAGIFHRPQAEGGSLYRFRHVLIQEAAYESLLKSNRRELHGRIVRLVTEGAVAGLSDETISWHFAQAARPLEAARHAILAAEACVARSAVHEADRLLDFAQAQLSQCDAAQTEELLLQLLAVRGPVAAALLGRGSDTTRAIYQQGVAICAGRKNQDRAKWFPLYWGWWFTAPDYETQRTRSDILLRDLEGSADPEVRLQSLHCAWATNIDAGLHAVCLKCVEEGLRLYDEERALHSRGRYGGHDAKVCALGERAFSLWFFGDEVAAAESMDAAMRWADSIDHLNSTLHALEFAIELNRYRDDYAGVVAVADRIMDLGQAMPSVLTKATLFRSWAQAMSGDVAAALDEFEAAFARQREIGTYEGIPIYDGMRAEIFERAGRHEDAVAVLDEAIVASTRSGQVYWLAELYRQRAVLRHASGHRDEDVAADLRRAAEIAAAQQATALSSRVLAEFERLGLPRPSSSRS